MNDNRVLTLLGAIPSTEPCSFYEFVAALGDDGPEKEDKRAWWELFQDLEELERSALISVKRDGRRIESIILTEVGAARVRESRMERPAEQSA